MNSGGWLALAEGLEEVSRFGLAVRRWAGKAERPRFESASALLSLQKSWSVDSLVTLSLIINKALKWLSSLPTLMQESSR